MGIFLIKTPPWKGQPPMATERRWRWSAMALERGPPWTPIALGMPLEKSPGAILVLRIGLGGWGPFWCLVLLDLGV